MHFKMSSAICFNLDQSKILPSGNGLNVAKMTILLFDRAENTVGKAENAGYQHFHLFPTMFSKTFFFGVVKSRDCLVKS